MDNKSLNLLEQVFQAEIDGAMSGGPGLFQTKRQLAKQLEKDGYLESVTVDMGGVFPVSVTGYRLTLLGNATYCLS